MSAEEVVSFEGKTGSSQYIQELDNIRLYIHIYYKLSRAMVNESTHRQGSGHNGLGRHIAAMPVPGQGRVKRQPRRKVETWLASWMSPDPTGMTGKP